MAGANATKHSAETSQLAFPINEEDRSPDGVHEKRKKKGNSERNKHFSKFSMTKPGKHKEEKRSLVLKPTRSKELIQSTKAKNPWTKAKEGKNGCCTVLKNIAVSAATGGAIALRPGQMSVKVPGKRGRKPKVVPPISPNKGTVLTASCLHYHKDGMICDGENANYPQLLIQLLQLAFIIQHILLYFL